jgi:arylsulfatase A-like enzyme
MVGQLFQRLADLGESDTLAFFISDNGFSWGDHRLLGSSRSKNTPYRESVQVPMFMLAPGQERQRDPRLVANIDIAETILDALSVPVSPSVPMDGRSLLDEGGRRWLLIERWGSKAEATEVPGWRGLVGLSRQYDEYLINNDRTGFREYYNLKKDPWMLENVLQDRHRRTPPIDVHLLHQKLRRFSTCSGKSCP